jgi:hypothetical protein
MIGNRHGEACFAGHFGVCAVIEQHSNDLGDRRTLEAML